MPSPYTLTADAGAFTQTGQGAQLIYNGTPTAYTFAPDAGVFTLTGVASLKQMSMVAGAGAFTQTGVASIWTFSGGPTFSNDAGAFTQSGQTARLREHFARYRNIYIPPFVA